MVNEREIYIIDQGGKYYITDQYDLNRVVFKTKEARQKWIDGFETATGIKPKVINQAPDVTANLERGTIQV